MGNKAIFKGFNKKTRTVFAQSGSIVGILMFVWAIFRQSYRYELKYHMEKYFQRIFKFVYPYIQITFNEFVGKRLTRSVVYSCIESYLSSTALMQAKRLKAADAVKMTTQTLVLSMDYFEEVTDEFKGVKVWWASGKHYAKDKSVSFHSVSDEKRYYQLTFHKRNRDLVLGSYLDHVLKEGKAIKERNRQRKLYTNSGPYWSYVVFEHPATFETLAMEEEKKNEIIEDLIAFSQSEEFYARIGRAWKRGYLIYGPPGTGKSTMIAAMANLLNYDVYDLELTAVKDNNDLRKLLIETSSKSIVVIEDIDCSLDLTKQRKIEKSEENREQNKEGKPDQVQTIENRISSHVTLSGLLNFIDGLWSACKGERLIVFTTNFVDKLDPALIRKGRMDKHVELSYCGFEAFKVLARKYLELESHELFANIGKLLGEIRMTPADVAEHLMPKTMPGNAQACLESLIQALEVKKGRTRREREGTCRPKAATEKDNER